MLRTPASAGSVVLLAALIGLAFVAAPASGASDPANPARACSVGAAGSPGAAPGAADLTIETFIAPGASYDRLTRPAALRAARANGTLVPASRGIDWYYEDGLVAERDVTVHRITLAGNATTLATRLATGNGSSPTERFQALVANGSIDFEYWGPSACPPELALNATINEGAMRVLPNTGNSTVYLVFDTDRLRFHPLDGGEPTTDTRVHGLHRLELSLPGAGGLVDDTVAGGTDYDVRRGHAELVSRHEGLVRVDALANRRLEGRTSFAPGSELTVRLVPYVEGDERKVASARVDRNRTFVVGVDLRDATNRTIYAVQIEPPPATPSVGAGATFVAVGNASGAVVDARNQTSNGAILYGPTITTTDGGFVTVRNAAGDRVGVSDYRKPGRAVAQIDLRPVLQSSQRVTVTVYRDVNGNRAFDAPDTPYLVDGSPVRDTAVVNVERDEPTPTTPSATSTSPEPSSPGTATVSPSPPATIATTSPGQSGFGIGPAMLCLLLLYRLRRRGDGS